MKKNNSMGEKQSFPYFKVICLVIALIFAFFCACWASNERMEL